MSAPYSAPRRLERSRSDRFIGGVCGGIAKYLNMDPTLVRILTVVITLFTFVPVVAYIIAMFVMPEEESDATHRSVNAFGAQNGYPTYPGTTGQTHDPVWGSTGAPWEQPQPAAQPAAQPTAQPSAQPTAQPTVQPTVQPAAQPSAQPSVQPAAQPADPPRPNGAPQSESTPR